MKIAICVPHYGDVKAGFLESLTNAIWRTMSAQINYGGRLVSPRIWTVTRGSASIDANRNTLVRDALKWGADYILFCDSDMAFPPDAILRLLAADQPVVGCNYAMRDGSGGTAGKAKGGDWRRVSAGAGVERIDFMGLGLCLLSTRIFDGLDGPWFRTTIGDNGEVLEGEDGHFFALLRQRGIPAFVHHDLSVHVGHLAERAIKLSDVGENDDVDTVLPTAGDQ